MEPHLFPCFFRVMNFISLLSELILICFLFIYSNSLSLFTLKFGWLHRAWFLLFLVYLCFPHFDHRFGPNGLPMIFLNDYLTTLSAILNWWSLAQQLNFAVATTRRGSFLSELWIWVWHWRAFMNVTYPIYLAWFRRSILLLLVSFGLVSLVLGGRVVLQKEMIFVHIYEFFQHWFRSHESII
jgi:hypothetical protein